MHGIMILATPGMVIATPGDIAHVGSGLQLAIKAGTSECTKKLCDVKCCYHELA